ncbi:MAG TPA: nuclear transport factor 2 family protein [Thermoanaerobaculia bacterium]|nr:nuclear transport factor 2 family protein [Thermoanaerobaculia bacterium]
MDTKKVGDRLVELCREGRNLDAIEELYSPDIASVEAMDDGTMPREMNGIDAIRGKNQWWLNNHEVHAATVEGPYPNGDRFTVKYHYEVTPKEGPMAGNRYAMDEVALYTVKDGRIVREEFFYAM